MGNISEKASATFKLLNLRGIGSSKIHGINKVAGSLGLSIEAMLQEPKRLVTVLKEEQLSQLVTQTDKVICDIEKLLSEDITLVSIFDPHYPQRLKEMLGEKCPVLLMAKGNLSLLQRKSVGFCGSRKASEKGIATAVDCSEQFANNTINVNSGYATGIDIATHGAALKSGGTTTIVLPEGILHFKIKKELRDYWDWNRVCVISEFLPNIPWSVQNAMQRNTTICALSKLVILIEAGATGGSIEAGKTSLKLGIPLLAPVYDGMPESAIGNRIMLENGAYPLHKSKAAARANLEWAIKVVCGDDNCKMNRNQMNLL